MMTKTFVRNMTGRTGRVANQLIITHDEGLSFFQSFETVIAFRSRKEAVLDRDRHGTTVL